MNLPANPTQPADHWLFIGLGSNLGNRAQHLQHAIDFLHAQAGIRVREVSSIYETPPFGPVPQGKFLNAVAWLECSLPPFDLLRLLKTYEKDAGRVETVRWGPRSIDLDILIYGNRQVADERLQIPHPGLPQRAFVLVPLAELLPELTVPGLTQTVQGLLEALPDRDGVIRWDGRG